MPNVHPDLRALIERRRSELGFAGEPMSIRAVARRAEERGHPVSPETVRQLVRGTHSGRIDDPTVDALCAALDVSRPEILRAMHETRQAPLGRWEPPDAAARLSLRQRRALEELIAAMVESAVSGDLSFDVVVTGAGDVQPAGAEPLSKDDRLANEFEADLALDQMARKRRTTRKRAGNG